MKNDHYEEIFKVVMRRGDEEIARRKAIRRRITAASVTVSGLCAAAVVCFGICADNNVKKSPEKNSKHTVVITEPAVTEPTHELPGEQDDPVCESVTTTAAQPVVTTTTSVSAAAQTTTTVTTYAEGSVTNVVTQPASPSYFTTAAVSGGNISTTTTTAARQTEETSTTKAVNTTMPVQTAEVLTLTSNAVTVTETSAQTTAAVTTAAETTSPTVTSPPVTTAPPHDEGSDNDAEKGYNAILKASFSDIIYTGKHNKTVAADMIEEEITTAAIVIRYTSTDDMKAELVTVYKIKDTSTDSYLAVRYDGDPKYYLFRNYQSDTSN